MGARETSGFRGPRLLNALIAILGLLVVFELAFDWEKVISTASTSGGTSENTALALEDVDLQDVGPDFKAYLQSPVLDRERAPIRLLTRGSGKTSGATIGGITLIGTLITEQERWALFRLQLH